MKKNVKIGNKGAAARIAEIYKNIREQPIPLEIYEILRGYKKEQLKKQETKIANNNDDKNI